ncbi:unnamed protein product [Microthlaspi erraticum]|uniref:Acetyltransferase n=1 Tax=Microthlaspi erraticum TaxID=1685480 RepID=A0A6D2KDL3_9BRAS|nr:unnamed protein product [Microthlaspi erraticum]
MRHRLNPPLGEECFGTLSSAGIAKTTVRELLDHGLGWAAMLINTTVSSHTSEKVKAFAKIWVKNVKTPVSFGRNTLVVTSSHRFDVCSNDFGWGKPIAARAGPPYLNGRLVLFQGLDEGSLDLQACLPLEVVVNLLKDGDFLEYVNTA